MYEQFYKFSAEPFRLSPDHAFAYAHKGYTKAKAYMTYAFMRAEGFVMITGRPGTGKTTLIGALLEGLAKQDVNVANLVCTQLKADDLLKMVAYEFGVSPSVVEKGELLQRLTHQFRAWHRDGHRALLIVDEAQDLSVSAMEELRLLTNIQVGSRPLLQIFLLGQPELRELILTPALEQIHQRIIAASHLQPLENDEAEAYIRHRLQTVGWRGDPSISSAVYPLIFKFSEGVPRRINLICSRLLLHCAVEQRHRVGVADVREIIQELQHENLAAGTRFSDSDFQVADVFDDDVREQQHDGGIEAPGGNPVTAAGSEAVDDAMPEIVEPPVGSCPSEAGGGVAGLWNDSAGRSDGDGPGQRRPPASDGEGHQHLKVVVDSAAGLPSAVASADEQQCRTPLVAFSDGQGAESVAEEVVSPVAAGSVSSVAPVLDSANGPVSLDAPDLAGTGQVAVNGAGRGQTAGGWPILVMLIVSILLVLGVVLGFGGG
ncbi:MAG: AAA family ATPase [Porticoccaceae bacterium]